MNVLGFIKDDSRGFAFSLDLLLALIPLTLAIGIIGADMDHMFYTMQDTVFGSSMDRAAADALSMLIETSGQPNDWELSSNAAVAGLARYDYNRKAPTEGLVSSIKMGALTESDIQKLVGDDYGFFLNITCLNGTTGIKPYGTYNSSASHIARVERIALYGRFDIVSSLENAIRDAGIPREYIASPDFPTNKRYLNVYDYWVVVVNRGYDSATVEINGDNNFVVKGDDFNGQATRYISFTRKVDETFLKNETNLENNHVIVRTVSNPGASMDVYVLQVPQGTDEGDIPLTNVKDNIKPKPYKFELYLWAKG